MKTINKSPTTVLAIEAEAESLARLTAVLEGAGYCCVSATSASAANDAVRQATPDFIICDVNVAGHSGPLMCDELRRRSELAEVPVMFLSSKQTPDIIRRAHSGGGTYYLRTPFDSKVLLQLVEKGLGAPQFTTA